MSASSLQCPRCKSWACYQEFLTGICCNCGNEDEILKFKVLSFKNSKEREKMNDFQSKEDRTKQLNSYIKSNKVAIKELSKSNQAMRLFYENHNMVIHGLKNNVLHPLGEIINTLENQLEKYEKELKNK